MWKFLVECLIGSELSGAVLLMQSTLLGLSGDSSLGAAVGGAGSPCLPSSAFPLRTASPAQTPSHSFHTGGDQGGDYASGLWGDPMGIALIWCLALIFIKWITSKVGHFIILF